MKSFETGILLFISAACLGILGCEKSGPNQNSVQIAEMQKKISDLEQRIEDTKPSLSGIMSGVQRHHTKLDYSGVHTNWKLAAYELNEIKEGIEHAAKSNPVAKAGPAMMAPSIEALSQSIKTENVDKFAKDFQILTQACNQCHHEQQHDFIVIENPAPGMFSDQKFGHF